jgi:hypothetical protein
MPSPMTEHERKADDLERELEDMEEQADRLGGEIDETREDWQRKQRDDGVPGAVGEPPDEDDGDEEPPPEAQEPPGDEVDD